MAELHLEVGVVVARQSSHSAWASMVWVPCAVLPSPPRLAVGACISRSDNEELIYAGPAALTLYASEASHYRDNLLSDRPSVWIALSDSDGIANVDLVTADPYEGEALAEVYGAKIDAAPMPQAIFHSVSEFVAQHFVERQFIKRSRT